MGSVQEQPRFREVSSVRWVFYDELGASAMSED